MAKSLHMYDNEDKEKTPLTKGKSKKYIQSDTESETEPDIEPEEVKPVIKEEKVKKPRSEKQIQAFVNAQEKRKANIELKKQEKKVEASKIILEHETKTAKPVKKAKEVAEVESSSEEEVIIIETKKKSKKPKKPKRIIVEESESESEEEEAPAPKKEKSFKSQQNKRSVIQVHKPIPSDKNTVFFV
jgi:hypothetical protein